MGRLPDLTTKENIIFKAFLLFSKKPYYEVTFEELEKLTNLSRGALLYHVKTKQNLFNMVVESSLLNRSSIVEIPLKKDQILKHFILDFIKECEKVVKTMKGYGINNINLAHYNIESQALYHYNNFNKISIQMKNTELKVWSSIVEQAKATKEITSKEDTGILAALFLNAYLGHAYSAAKEENGCDLDLLENELLSLYNLMK